MNKVLNWRKALIILCALTIVWSCNPDRETTSSSQCNKDSIAFYHSLADSQWLKSTLPYEKLLNLYSECDDTNGMVWSTLFLTRNQLNNYRNFSYADSVLRSLERIRFSSLSKDTRALYFLTKSGLFLNTNRDSMLYYNKKALDLNPSIRLRSELIFNEGYFAISEGKLGLAHAYFNTVRKSTMTLLSPKSYSLLFYHLSSLNSLAMCSQLQDKPDSAFIYLVQCARIQDSLFPGDLPVIPVNGNIGNILIGLGDTMEGVNYYQKEYDSYRREKLSFSKSHVYATMLYGYGITNNRDSIQVLLTEFDSYVNYCRKGSFYDMLSNLYVEKSRYILKEDAFRSNQLIDSALMYAKIAGIEISTRDIQLHKGKVLIKLQDYKNAIAVLLPVYDYFRKGIYLENTNEASRLLYLGYKGLGDKQAAFQYLEVYSRLSDSLAGSERLKTTARLTKRYQLEKKEAQILQMELNELQFDNKQRKKNVFIGLAFLLSALVLVFAYYRNRLRKKKFALELKSKETLMLKEIEKTQSVLSDKFMEQQERYKQELGALFHDNIGALLSTLKLYIQKMGHRVQELSEPAKKEVDKTNELLDQLTEEVRLTSRKMSAGMVNSLGLLGAVEDITRNISGSGIIESSFYSNLKADTIDSQHQIQLFRIVQEAVSNAVKHAQANHIDISILEGEGELILKVEDDGKGFNKEIQTNGMGLSNLISRAKKIGAKLNIATSLGSGTSVFLIYPLAETLE